MKSTTKPLLAVFAGLLFLSVFSHAEEEGMVLVAAGEFTMGSNAGFKNEVPERKVKLKAYYIDKYEVSNKDYKKFTDATSRTVPKHWVNGMYNANEENCPVVNVSWDDADAYAKWAGKRLPTEEEWEKAARYTDARKYPWGNQWDETKCNSYNYLGKNSLKPVNSYPEGKSMYGCYNMGGNAWEWTSDWYKLVKKDDSNLNQKYRIVKGGSWLKLGLMTRCPTREALPPGEGYADVGFRCIKDAQ